MGCVCTEESALLHHKKMSMTEDVEKIIPVDGKDTPTVLKTASELYKKTSQQTVMFVVRLLLFCAYAAAAIVLFTFSVGKNACFVQSTYKQEFLVNIVGNPFFSNSAIVTGGPKSKLEMMYYNAKNHTQKASDIGIFPNLIHDVYNNSAFWPVEYKPGQFEAAGEYIPVSHVDDGTFYMGDYYVIRSKGIPIQGGAGQAFQNMLRHYMSNIQGPGMQLPNFLR